jgi:hypothetical protein
MKIINKNAFTFVETLVVVLISTAAFAGIYSTFIVGNKAWAHYNNSVAVKKEARRALFGMVNELREAQNVRVVQSHDGTALHFYRPSIGNVSYVWTRKGDSASRIIRHSNLETRIVAQHILALSFEPFHNAIMIELSAGKQTDTENAIQVALREKVALRSKTSMFE